VAGRARVAAVSTLGNAQMPGTVRADADRRSTEGDEFTDLLGIYSLTPSPQLPSGISMTTTWVPWYDILLFFLRVGLTKIWELGTDPIAIRGSAVLEGPV
jgi:hypothetical protein